MSNKNVCFRGQPGSGCSGKQSGKFWSVIFKGDSLLKAKKISKSKYCDTLVFTQFCINKFL